VDVDVYLCSELSGDGEKNLKDINKLVDILLNNKVPQTLSKRLVHDNFFHRKTFFKYNTCVAKRIFSLLVTAFLIFVPIVSVSIISSPINSDQNEISASLYPKNVHRNDTMYVNISVPFSFDISSVVADMGGLETVILSHWENNSYVKLWQASWVVPDVDSGDYVAAITLMNDTNGSFVLEKTWSILPDEIITSNNCSDGIANETNNQVNQSTNSIVKDENYVEVPTNNSLINSIECIKSNGSAPNIVHDNTSENNQSMDCNSIKSFFTNSTEPAPTITETTIDNFHKLVTIASDIHYTNITAFSTIDNRPNGTIHLYHVINGSRMEVGFTSFDLDNDSLVDRIEWTVPHLSEQTYEIIIEIIKAEHLYKNRVFLSDIYDDVKAKDGRWSEPIYNGEYVRVTFERALEKDNDITIVARSTGTSRIEVYAKNSESLIATFENINSEHRYKIFLTNLSDSQIIFDLRTSGDAIEYDYIVDPTGWVSPTGNADPSIQWTSETKAYDENTGSYAVHAGGAGWRGFLELTLSSSIYCDCVRVFSDFGYGIVDLVDIDIYNSTSWIDKYNGTISDCAWTELEFSGETNVTKARFRYHYLSGSYQFYFYEFDFWQGKPHTLPNGTTLNATSVDETTAILNGNVSDDGGEPCEYRFQYGSDTSYGNNTTWGGSEAQNSEFSAMIHNLILENTYQYRVQIRNDIGTINGSNKNFTTAIPSLGWVTPTSHYDSNSQWSNEINAYDDGTDTYTQSYHTINDPDGLWSFYIYLNHSVILCDKVRFYARGPTGDSIQVDQVDLDVKRGGVWVNVYEGTFSDRQWVEKSFMQGSVNQSRIRFRINANNGGLYYQLYEFDFNNSRPVPTITNEGPTNRSWSIYLRPQMNITVNNRDGNSMTISWSSNSSGSWQLFGINSSIGNGTYHQQNNNFSSNNSKYWWKVSVTDGIDTNSSFSTPDTINPSSNVVAITPYWKKTSPLTITTTASDTGWSGLKNVTLYYRFSSNNVSWGGWVSAGVDTASPWSWNVAFSNGSGYYQFYSIAKDNATNVEVAPGSADAKCGYDNTVPTSSVSSISVPYWKKISTLTVSATASDTGGSGLKNVTLYYYNSSNNITWYGPWNFGVDSDPWVDVSWSFTFPKGIGYYRFYSDASDNATNMETAPVSNDTFCGYDNSTPSSTVYTIIPYWKKTSLITITVSTSDTLSGVKNVTLYYRFSSNNASWSGWVSAGVDTASPWSWSFAFSNGTGYYQFYCIANDNATNNESIPGDADAWCGYDDIAPSSSVTTTLPYWKTASGTITATASDGLSGVKNVTLYYRFSSNNASWSEWVSAGVDTASPWSWSFAFSNGSGNYQFYSLAVDNATNTESAPGSSDAICGYDAAVPSSSVDVITPYWKASSPLAISATVSDNGPSGLKNVTLYYYNSSNNNTWYGPWNFGTITNPWVDVSWSFTFPKGLGYYRFYSRATDNASNIENAPLTNDTFCGYDTNAPTSSVTVISTPYWKNTRPLMITATASPTNGSGLKNVTLYYYNSSNNNTWYGPWSFGVDSDPWVAVSWSFTFSKNEGFYRFYSIAVDNVSNIESAPLVNDTHCGYDDQPPACTITYNRSATYFKANDSLRIYANCNDVHSGINESSVIIAISTIGNGSLNNVSMNMIDNTHWYYDWIIPLGSDDDGPFNVSIYANDNAFNILDPYPTTDDSKQIDNTAPVISSVSVSDISLSSVTINWMTNENATSYIAYGANLSYDLWSNTSGWVTSHSCPLTGLFSGTTYHYLVISYDLAGNQNTSSDENFTTSSTQTSKSEQHFHNVIENKPPSNPTIDGPIGGHINLEYNFSVRSTDANNDTIIYTFNWGDGIIESSGFLPNGINCIKNHSWTKAGKYTIKVTASDNRTSSSSEKTVWIDAVAISDLGYLLDSDSDGIFDSFHNVATGEETLTEMRNGIYLIDLDGDHQWDYEYNSSSGMIALINQQPSMTEAKPQFPVLWLGGLLFAVVVVLAIFLYRRRPPKDYATKKR
jgi:hypothetical protein